MATMEKNKNKDRHKTQKMTFRPSEIVKQMIQVIAEKEERTKAKVIERAVRLYAEQNGYEWPTPKKE
jgi:predicted transcriptional regulator